MGKEIFVSDKSDLAKYKQILYSNLQKSFENMKYLLDHNDCTSAFEYFKYEKTVIDPLTGNPENLIELMNSSGRALSRLFLGCRYLPLQGFPDSWLF